MNNTLLNKEINENILKEKIELLDEKNEYSELMKIVYDSFCERDYLLKKSFNNIVFNNYENVINNSNENNITIICFDSVIDSIPSYISKLSQNKKVKSIIIFGNHKKIIKNEKIFCINLTNKLKIEKILNEGKTFLSIINFDIINAKKIFYNTQKCFIENNLLEFYEKEKNEIVNNQNNVCMKIISNTKATDFSKLKLLPSNYILLEEIIRTLDKINLYCIEKNINFVFNNIIDTSDKSVENSFIKDVIDTAFGIISITNKEERYSFLYDYTCEQLNHELAKTNYCRFKNNQCIWQRHKKTRFSYPHGKFNGCCYNDGRNCKHWHEGGKCDTNCISCKLFTCPYLQSIGISHALYDFPMLLFFIPRKKNMKLIFSFFTPKDVIMKKLLK